MDGCLFAVTSRTNHESLAVVGGDPSLRRTLVDGNRSDVLHGLLLVGIGSIVHAMTYVTLEGIMTVGDDKLSIAQNCAVQGMVAAMCFFSLASRLHQTSIARLEWRPDGERGNIVACLGHSGVVCRNEFGTRHDLLAHASAFCRCLHHTAMARLGWRTDGRSGNHIVACLGHSGGVCRDEFAVIL